MNRIEHTFTELKREGKKALIAFITAGYPDLAVTKELIFELARSGADIIELGVPFSDPMADGPVIQESSAAALKAGVNLDKILNLVKEARRKTASPICLMTYYNPIFCFGEEKFVKKANSCGVDGVIIPDLPPEEGSSLIKLAKKYRLDTIFFISPTTARERVKFIASASSGFIYYVSLTGVTGPRKNLPSDLIRNITAIKKLTSKPVCVGFGISEPGQIRQISRVADGAILGSAIIRKIKENIGRKDLVKKVGIFVRNLCTTKQS